MFDAIGTGASPLTDAVNNMGDLFEADNEVVTFSTIDEAVEKMNYLKEPENVAAEIAMADQKRTLKDHTIKASCRQIDELFQANLCTWR